jgi:hypothetical protein
MTSQVSGMATSPAPAWQQFMAVIPVIVLLCKRLQALRLRVIWLYCELETASVWPRNCRTIYYYTWVPGGLSRAAEISATSA